MYSPVDLGQHIEFRQGGSFKAIQTEEEYAFIREEAIEIFPFLRELPIKRTWAGWMPFTRDLRPVIGKIPHFENLYVLTGLGSAGFERGPMAGKLLADCIHNGVASPILSEADPAQQVTL